MSVIYDSFPSQDKAEAFVEAVRKLGIRADVWDSHEEMNAAGRRASARFFEKDYADTHHIDPQTGKVCDVFPFSLVAPIVAVRRHENEDAEWKADAMVTKYGGVCAGT